MDEKNQNSDDKYISGLYSELNREAPSDELDEKILAEARKAVDEKPKDFDKSSSTSTFVPTKKGNSPFSGNWKIPVSLAAVIVLSVTVILSIEKERPYSLTSVPEATIPSSPSPSSSSETPRDESASGKPLAAPLFKKDVAKKKVKAKFKPVRAAKQKPDSKNKLSSAQITSTAKNTSAISRRPEKQRKDITATTSVSGDDTVVANAAGDKIKNNRLNASVSATLNEPSNEIHRGMLKDDIASPTAKIAAGSVGSMMAGDSMNKPVTSGFSEEEDARQVLGENQDDKEQIGAISSEQQQATTAAPGAQSIVTESIEESESIEPAQESATLPIARERASEELEKSEDIVEQDVDKEIAQASLSGIVTDTDTSVGMKQEQCASLSISDCLTSRQCSLELDKGSQKYQCRLNNNHCEQDFSQAEDTLPYCEAKSGCEYQAGECFCEPDTLCACSGGTPPMCKEEQDDF